MNQLARQVPAELAELSVEPDLARVPLRALRVDVAERAREIPIHRHEAGQLVIALRGAVSCDVPGALWIVPPQAGVWIPGGTPHSNHSTSNARLFYLFVAPGAAELPTRCCTLRISPLVSEMIQHLAGLSAGYEQNSPTDRFGRVLLDQLSVMPSEDFFLPMSEDDRIGKIFQAITRDASDRRTLHEWAEELCMNERTMSRLFVKQTGLSFGLWRRNLHLLVAIRELAGGATVQQVAYDLGYESAPAFITMFKKALGKPPATYISDRLKPNGDEPCAGAAIV